MSLNGPTGPAPHERIVLTNENVSIKLTNPTDATVISATAKLVLSNTRVVLVASPVTYRVAGKGDREFRSLSVNIVVRDGGIKQSRLVQPWFGPNKWEALIIPDSSRSFEPHCPWLLSIAFKSGGVFEFTEKFSSLASAAATARQEGIEEVLPPYVP